MASTTFSGPIKAGTISNTTGTTLGDNVKNVGQVVMTQSSDVALTHATTTATALGIIIPANSQICLLYTSPSPRDRTRSRMPSSA